MLVLGIILVVVGLLTGLGLLVTLGIILAVIGLVLLLMGGMNRTVGGRRYWY